MYNKFWTVQLHSKEMQVKLVIWKENICYQILRFSVIICLTHWTLIIISVQCVKQKATVIMEWPYNGFELPWIQTRKAHACHCQRCAGFSCFRGFLFWHFSLRTVFQVVVVRESFVWKFIANSFRNGCFTIYSLLWLLVAFLYVYIKNSEDGIYKEMVLQTQGK
jgi:hypothetical protein